MSQQNLMIATAKKYLNQVDQDFKHVGPLNSFTQKLGIKPSQLIIPIFLLSLLMLASGLLSHLFVAIFGMLYPSYMTFKALKSNDQSQSKGWLTYWIVFGLFTAFSRYLRWIFFFLSIPSYNVFRILFYVWLFHPRTNGAAYIYKNHLKASLEQIKKDIETPSLE